MNAESLSRALTPLEAAIVSLSDSIGDDYEVKLTIVDGRVVRVHSSGYEACGVEVRDSIGE